MVQWHNALISVMSPGSFEVLLGLLTFIKLQFVKTATSLATGLDLARFFHKDKKVQIIMFYIILFITTDGNKLKRENDHVIASCLYVVYVHIIS